MSEISVDDLEAAALPFGTLAVFAIAAVTTPLTSRVVDEVVLGALVVIVFATGVVGGRLTATCVAITAAFSFDFFHVEPIRVLHGTTLLAVAALLLTIALLAGWHRTPARGTTLRERS